MTPTYRPDIDGLRAIAVLAVLFYHSGIGFFSGGYVGVDVFFVISGYLITTIIVREIGLGKFSIAGFYERRMRRILPAIITTVAACLLIGYALLETSDFEDLARSSIANNLFLSNIYFYWQTGYFDAPAELKPLLHTWSLSLEEQYYVVMPVLLLLIARFCKQRFLLFVVPVFIVSFAACVYGMASDPSAVFYMLPTRAWELLIGSILAIATLPRLPSEGAMQGLAAIGLALVLTGILGFDDQTAFPGAYAAIPTIGTAILIYTGRAGMTLVNRLLSARLMVFVGLISYSLYLWHWPLIVYARYLKAEDLTQTEKMALIVVMIAVATLSWRFVETPFRKKKLLATRKSIFVGSLVATTTVILAGLAAIVSLGDQELDHWKACENIEERIAENRGLCRIGDDSAAPHFLLWGDSHARSWASAVNVSAQRKSKSGYLASKTACAPLLGIERQGRKKCLAFNETVFSFIEEHSEIDTVILSARWGLAAEGSRYKEEDGDPIVLIDTLATAGQPEYQHELTENALYRTVLSLQEIGKRVLVVGPVPEVGYDVPSVNHIALITNRDVNSMIAPSRSDFDIRNRNVLSTLSRLQDELHVKILSPSTLLCDDTICRVALEGGLALYRDDHHLSTFGAKYISELFDAEFDGQEAAADELLDNSQ
jgi:peptidoglycan/LPS O-acetylase OafA/YrhL